MGHPRDRRVSSENCSSLRASLTSPGGIFRTPKSNTGAGRGREGEGMGREYVFLVGKMEGRTRERESVCRLFLRSFYTSLFSRPAQIPRI
eukprot:1363315-Amorphochlora_amoeboformis.AAC.1